MATTFLDAGLCSPDEKELFKRLKVFLGIDSAETAICSFEGAWSCYANHQRSREPRPGVVGLTDRAL